MQFDKHSYTTIFGNKLELWTRDTTVDFDLHQGLLVEDEYGIHDLMVRQGLKFETAIDIGSYAGSMAMLLGSQGIKTLAVEPVRENVELIQKNIDQNNLGHLVKIAPYAMGGRRSQARMVVQRPTLVEDNNLYESRHRFVAKPFPSGVRPLGGLHERDSEVITLNLAEAAQLLGVEKFDLIKCDCEGAEWEIFQREPGDPVDQILQQAKIITLEIHGWGGAPGLAPGDTSILQPFERLLGSCFVNIVKDVREHQAVKRPDYPQEAIFINKNLT